MGKIIMFVIIFLIIGGIIIATTYDLDLNKSSDRDSFIKRFFVWLFHLGKNTKDVVDYAADKTWLPNNETNMTTIVIEENASVNSS